MLVGPKRKPTQIYLHLPHLARAFASPLLFPSPLPLFYIFLFPVIEACLRQSVSYRRASRDSTVTIRKLVLFFLRVPRFLTASQRRHRLRLTTVTPFKLPSLHEI